MVRPEHKVPPEIHYNERESVKYTASSRNRNVQKMLAERALELLLLPSDESALLLDVGCGSGLSGDYLTERGYNWIGIDLNIAVERETQGDLIQNDIGEITRFRPGVFDGAISISTIQWLLNADTKSQNPYKRITCFFKWLYYSLKLGSRAVLHAYIENAKQLEIFTSVIAKCNFGGGVVVDYPDSSRARKYFFVIWAGISLTHQTLPAGLTNGEADESQVILNKMKNRSRQNKNMKKRSVGKKWILEKKASQRKLGKVVRPDTKYTGRKRPDKF